MHEMYYQIKNKIVETDTFDFGFENLGGVGDVLFHYMKKHENETAQLRDQQYRTPPSNEFNMDMIFALTLKVKEVCGKPKLPPPPLILKILIPQKKLQQRSEMLSRIDASTGKTETFELLLQKCIRTALSLKEKGIKTGDIVTVCSQRNFNGIVPIIASTFMRMVPCVVSPTVSAIEIKQILEITKPKVLFTSKNLLDCIKGIVKLLNFKPGIVIFDGADESSSFESFLTFRNGEEEFQPSSVGNLRETCAMVCRNEASGISKLVSRNHHYYLKNVYLFLAKTKNSASFVNYNATLEGSIENFILSAVKGQSMWIFNSFSVDTFWENVSKYNISDVSLDYNDFKELARDGKPEDSNTNSLKRIIIIHSTRFVKKSISTLQNGFPEIEFIIAYEHIETGPLTILQVNNKNRELFDNEPEVIGLPVHGLRYRVVDLKTERNLGSNEEGELRVKGLTISNGNHKNITPDRFDRHGWFKTGKIVCYDDNCFFHLAEKERSKIRTDRDMAMQINEKRRKYQYSKDENNIISTPMNFPLNEKGLGHLFFNSMQENSNNVAQYIVDTNEEDTFGNLLKRCIRTALHLQEYNLKRDDVVMLCTDNHKNSCVPPLAAFFLGLQVACLDPTLSVLDTTHLIKEIQPKIIFISSGSTELIEGSLSNTGLAPDIIVFDDCGKYRSFNEFLQGHENEETFSPTSVSSLEDPLLIVFSSGTTGLPKGIVLNNYTLMTQGYNFWDLGFTSVNLCYSSYYWISAFLFLTASILSGGARIVCSKFDPVQLWYLLDRYRVNFIFLSPPAAISMIEAGRPKGVDTSSLSYFFTGGDKVSDNNLTKLRENLPGTIILQGYGQSEVSGLLTVCKSKDPYEISLLDEKPNSVGTPMRGFSLKIVNPDNEQICGPYEQGELRVKSKIMMNGYYKRDASESFDSNGWLRTGDILYYDEDLFFFYVERIKEMMKYKSWHVTPAAVEKIILDHPAVLQAVVLGIPHPEDGDHPIALVIPNDKYKGNITPEEIQNFVAERAQDRMKLRGGVKFLHSIPLTPTGKINRRKLKHMILKGEI